MTRILKADRTGPRVVAAAVHDAGTQAREILARARADADGLRERARDEGRAAGRAELAAELAHVAAARERLLGELEAQAVEVAMLAARRILEDELAATPERILDIVRPLLIRLRHARQLTLKVHPEDRPSLERALEDLRRQAELACAIALETDASLTRGGCVVTSDAGVLDARLEVRLDALHAALRGS